MSELITSGALADGTNDAPALAQADGLREWSTVPIIVLSARGQEADKIAALDCGADDYLTKPFSMGELLARIRVVLRPGRRGDVSATEPNFQSGRLAIDSPAREVSVAGKIVHMTPLEYKLLCVFTRNYDRVLTHRQLLTEVWGAAYTKETHYLRIYMKQLRHKLEADPAQPQMFTTEPGIGYRFRRSVD